MKDELIERLHGSELFLRNIAKAKPAPLNGYSKECLLDASEYICQAIEEIHRLKKDAAEIDEFARGICRERMLNGKAIADFEDLQKYIQKEISKEIKVFALKIQTFCKKNVIFDSSTEEGEFMAFIDNLVKERAGE